MPLNLSLLKREIINTFLTFNQQGTAIRYVRLKEHSVISLSEAARIHVLPKQTFYGKKDSSCCKSHILNGKVVADVLQNTITGKLRSHTVLSDNDIVSLLDALCDLIWTKQRSSRDNKFPDNKYICRKMIYKLEITT